MINHIKAHYIQHRFTMVYVGGEYKMVRQQKQKKLKWD